MEFEHIGPRAYLIPLPSLSAHHREESCPLFSSCLDLAASSNWKGWSCRWCKLFWAIRKEVVFVGESREEKTV